MEININQTNQKGNNNININSNQYTFSNIKASKNLDNDRIGILTFEKYSGKRKNWAGSSRIRGRWLTNHWNNAEIFKMGEKYDVIIYQKAYWIEHAKEFKGIKILDLCDPDWLNWGYQVKEMIEEVDAITTSSEALAEVVRKFTDKKVVCIPDRMDLDFHKEKKYHSDRAKWAVWFGYSSNFEILKPVLHFLNKFNLSLIVIADSPLTLPSSFSGEIELKNYTWNIDTINRDIISGDIVLNPKGLKGKWKFKSNNKTLTGWALGMPVAHNVEELEKFLEADERNKEAKLRLQEIKDEWDIKYSVKEYQDLINEIKEKR